MPTRLEIKTALENDKVEVDPVKQKKKLWDLLALTISMAGAQVAWTVELGFVVIDYSSQYCNPERNPPLIDMVHLSCSASASLNSSPVSSGSLGQLVALLRNP